MIMGIVMTMIIKIAVTTFHFYCMVDTVFSFFYKNCGFFSGKCGVFQNFNINFTLLTIFILIKENTVNTNNEKLDKN